MSGHRNRLDIRVGIEIDLVSVNRVEINLVPVWEIEIALVLFSVGIEIDFFVRGVEMDFVVMFRPIIVWLPCIDRS